MKKNSICKFSEAQSSDLICTNFVYETENVQAEGLYAEIYILGFVTDGCGTLSIAGTKYDLHRGSIFFVNKKCHFSLSGKDGFSYVYISFYGRRADELVERFCLSESRCVFDLSESYDELYTFSFSFLRRADEKTTDILSECALLYLLSFLEAKDSSANDLISTITTLTLQNFSDVNFSLGSLSEMMNYDSKYLSFYFKKHKKICYSEYLRDIRIRHSVFLIEQGLTSIKNIALLSGFTDALYFSKVFKKKMEKNPREYIKDTKKEKINE